MRSRARALPRRSRGIALLLLVTLLTMGMLFFILHQLDDASNQYIRANTTNSDASALDQARTALLGYAATYRDRAVDQYGNNTNTEVFGYLPCPDFTGDGSADPNTGGNCNSANGQAEIGLFPYKTLGLPDLRDGSGVCLWYAVAGNYKAATTKAKPMNWDTQGQFKIVDSNGNVLAAPDDAFGGAAAVIFATGAPILNQSRTATTYGPCQIDPAQVTSYLDGNYVFASSGTITLQQGPATNANGQLTINDRLAWVTPRDIFDRVVKRKDFSNPITTSPVGQLNKLTDEIKAAWEKLIQDDLVAGTTTASQISNTGSFNNTFSDKKIGTLPTSLALKDASFSTYYENWYPQYRMAQCSSLSTPCLTVNGTACRGILLFGGRGVDGAPRTSAQQVYATGNLSSYFENGSGLNVLTSEVLSFSGLAAYTENGSASNRALDVGTCLFPGDFKSFAQDIANVGATLGFQSGVVNSSTAIAAVDTTIKAITLGNTGGSAGSGCAWYPSTLAFSSNFRLYFRLRFTTKGNGFAVALADGATNLGPTDPAMCGSSDSDSLGYAGSPATPPGLPGIQRPKIAVEFDTHFSSGKNDPPGDHMAFDFWGTTSDTDGSDDNAHYLGSGGVRVTNASWATGNATLTTASPHGFTAGQVVVVSGLSPSGYNGTVTVSSPTTTQFSYVLAENPGTFSGEGQAKALITSTAPRNPRITTAVSLDAPRTILSSDSVTSPLGSTTTRSTSYNSSTGNVSIVTATAHGLSAGDLVVISGVSPAAYNGTFTVLQSGLRSSRPYQFRYALNSNPGSYSTGGTARKVLSSEISTLSWAGSSASATTLSAHGFSDTQPVTIFGVTPSGYGISANLVLTDSTHFSYPLATDPLGSFSTESPAGMAMVKLSDTHLPYSKFPTDTDIYVRIDLNRTYDATNHVVMLNMKAYMGNSFPLGDACGIAEFKDLSRDLAVLCPGRTVTLQQDSIPLGALATISAALWTAGTQKVSVTTAAPHGLVNGAKISISDAAPASYNGVYSIQVTSANTFEYAAAANPGSYISGGYIQPMSTVYFGFTTARGSSNASENQNITISDLLLRSQ